MDLPIIDDFTNIFSFKLGLDKNVDLSICFIPGVKSKITQNGKYIHVVLRTKMVFNSQVFGCFYCESNKDFVSLYLHNRDIWLHRWLALIDINNVSQCQMSFEPISLYGYVTAITLRVPATIPINLTSLEIQNNVDSFTSTKIRKHITYEHVYFIVDTKNLPISFEAEKYIFKANFSNPIETKVNMSLWYYECKK